jgi:hypothetical protein
MQAMRLGMSYIGKLLRQGTERAAAVLTGLLMDVPDAEDVHSVACQVLAKVKELALERQMNESRARLKALEAAGDRSGADELFRKVMSLQAERDSRCVADRCPKKRKCGISSGEDLSKQDQWKKVRARD